MAPLPGEGGLRDLFRAQVLLPLHDKMANHLQRRIPTSACELKAKCDKTGENVALSAENPRESPPSELSQLGNECLASVQTLCADD